MRTDSTIARTSELSSNIQQSTTPGFPNDRATRPFEDGSHSPPPLHTRFSTSTSSQVFQPDNDKHLGTDNQYGMPQPPHGSAHHGYTLPYPSSHYFSVGESVRIDATVRCL